MPVSVPTVLAALAGGNQNLALIDADFTALTQYINAREITSGTLAARPAAGTQGRWYFATDDFGGTLYFDNGATWIQVSPGLTPVTLFSLTDAAEVTVTDAGTDQVISTLTATVPASSKIAVTCSGTAMKTSGASPDGSLELLVGTGPTPPVLGVASFPLHIFTTQEGAFTYTPDAVVSAWGGGTLTVLVRANIPPGAAQIKFGVAGDARFQRLVTLTCYR